MKSIGIIGTVGIPARYGGFETLTEYLVKNLKEKYKFTVYCSSPAYQEKVKTYQNARLIYLPLKGNGVQSIPYDILSLFLCARKNDIILILGVSGCIVLPFFRLFFKRKRLIINIDGLEHRREKWNTLTRIFLKYSEIIAVKFADTIITDNDIVKQYVLKEYGKESTLIAYAGDQVEKLPLSEEIRTAYSLPEKYACKVCRIEPENNIRMILEAFLEGPLPLVLVGNWSNNKYGIGLKNEFRNKKNLYLIESIYEQNILNQIRSNSCLYLHGHSAGGTNPALVEAMNLGLPVFTYDCAYNRATTLNKALYFKDRKDLQNLVLQTNEEELKFLGTMLLDIAKEKYSWKIISRQYEELFDN